ncbi:MAG: hypothetical protein EB120_06475, partial [Proteobacteria bacterium]|nr:hypothetical protein [Pseudomonadota bacterium]
GTRTVYAQFFNGAVASDCVSDTILFDNLPPSDPNLTVNNGSTFVNSTSVQLTGISATDPNGPVQMYITNTSGCLSGGNWENLASTKSWTLSSAQTNALATVYYKFKDGVGNETGCFSKTIPQCSYKLCGDTVSNSCYDDQTAKTAGFACVASGDVIEYATIPHYTFRIWKKKNEDKILPASGLWLSGTTDGWQKKLNPDGKTGFSSSYFTDWQRIKDRANPPNVYLDGTSPFSSGKWIYYTPRFTAQKIDAGSSSGVKWVDWLGNWYQSFGQAVWFAGNIKTCNVLGMRLPVLYELNLAKPSLALPTHLSPGPTFPGQNGSGVPTNTGTIWTATSYNAGTIGVAYWIHEPFLLQYGAITLNEYQVRCVLPES